MLLLLGVCMVSLLKQNLCSVCSSDVFFGARSLPESSLHCSTRDCRSCKCVLPLLFILGTKSSMFLIAGQGARSFGTMQLRFLCQVSAHPQRSKCSDHRQRLHSCERCRTTTVQGCSDYEDDDYLRVSVHCYTKAEPRKK